MDNQNQEYKNQENGYNTENGNTNVPHFHPIDFPSPVNNSIGETNTNPIPTPSPAVQSSPNINQQLEELEQSIAQKQNSQNTNSESAPIDYFQFQFTAPAKENKNPQSLLREVSSQPSKEPVVEQNPETTYQANEFQNCLVEKDNHKSQNEELEKEKITPKEEPVVLKKFEMPVNKKQLRKEKRYRRIAKISVLAFYIALAFFIYLFFKLLKNTESEFELSRSEITLAIHSTYQIEILADEDATAPDLYDWISLNPEIASVDDNGVVTAITPGTTTIQVKSKKNKTQKEITIKTISLLVKTIRFDKKNISLSEDEETTLTPIINEDKTVVVSLIWSSSDDSIVTVDDNGHLVAQKAGTATITVQEPNSGISASISVTVKEKPNKKPSNTTPSNSNSNTKVSVKSISLNLKEATLDVGETILVKATISPKDATNKKVTWESNNKGVATVDNGKITGISEGEATITVTTEDGKHKASIKVKVKKKEEPPTVVEVTGISLSDSSVTLFLNDEKILTATVLPDNATNKKVVWSSSNDTIVSVQNGVIKALAEGEATITVTTEDGKHRATCTVTVKRKEEPPAIVEVTEISLSNSSVSLFIGDEKTLTATVLPDNATNKKVVWSSSDDTIVSVKNGVIKALAEGEVTITVTTEDGKHKATCTVTVKKKESEPQPDPDPTPDPKPEPDPEPSTEEKKFE